MGRARVPVIRRGPSRPGSACSYPTICCASNAAVNVLRSVVVAAPPIDDRHRSRSRSERDNGCTDPDGRSTLGVPIPVGVFGARVYHLVIVCLPCARGGNMLCAMIAGSHHDRTSAYVTNPGSKRTFCRDGIISSQHGLTVHMKGSWSVTGATERASGYDGDGSVMLQLGSSCIAPFYASTSSQKVLERTGTVSGSIVGGQPPERTPLLAYATLRRVIAVTSVSSPDLQA